MKGELRHTIVRDGITIGLFQTAALRDAAFNEHCNDAKSSYIRGVTEE